jgi:glycosyltransferase involved in cell wall biosynthesis
MAAEPAELARSLGLEGAIHLLGRRADMPEVLSAFDVFVLPSESEGMSNAILEAMAMGRWWRPTGGTARFARPVRLLVPPIRCSCAGDHRVIEDRVGRRMGRAGAVVVAAFSRAMVRQGALPLHSAVGRPYGSRLRRAVANCRVGLRESCR